jgi:hypothetical protein
VNAAGVIAPSWSQRHRLGQIAAEAAGGRHNPHYTVLLLRLGRPLEDRALREAWRALQRRHPDLSCGFDRDRPAWHVGRPAAPAEPIDVEVLEAGEDSAVAALRGAIVEPFDLAHGPLLRLVTGRAADGLRWLALVVEHLVSDAWSLGVLGRELASLYRAQVDRRTEPPAARSLPFREWVERQNAFLDGSEGRAAIDAVAAELEPVGPIPELPIEGFSGRTTIRPEAQGTITHRLDDRLYEALAPTARTARLSRVNLVHAALHVALAELSSRAWVATTMTTANRDLPEVEETPGWLASKVVVATRSDAADFLSHFRRRMIAALELATVPWPRMIAELEPDALGRYVDRPYVTFNAVTRRMNDAFDDSAFADVPAEEVGFSVGGRDAAIATFWNEDAAGITATVQYKEDWYSREDVERLLAAVERVLGRWAAA